MVGIDAKCLVVAFERLFKFVCFRMLDASLHALCGPHLILLPPDGIEILIVLKPHVFHQRTWLPYSKLVQQRPKCARIVESPLAHEGPVVTIPHQRLSLIVPKAHATLSLLVFNRLPSSVYFALLFGDLWQWITFEPRLVTTRFCPRTNASSCVIVVFALCRLACNPVAFTTCSPRGMDGH
jgi:hypothetical protein